MLFDLLISWQFWLGLLFGNLAAIAAIGICAGLGNDSSKQPRKD